MQARRISQGGGTVRKRKAETRVFMGIPGSGVSAIFQNKLTSFQETPSSVVVGFVGLFLDLLAAALEVLAGTLDGVAACDESGQHQNRQQSG